MKNLIIFLVAASFGGFFMPSHSQPSTPKDMYEFAAPMTFMCVDSFARMMEILAKDHQEIPMVVSHLSPNLSLILFVNSFSTSSTVVVTKQTKEKEQACIVFGGASNGTSFSLNPNPVFPVENGVEG